MAKIEITKHVALLEEFETSNKLIRLGFGELQNISLNNNFYFLPFQLLSQGFERFMKAYICLGYLEKNGILPSFKYLKTLGHDLELLLREILKEYYIEFKRIQFKEDREFILTNSDLKELLFIISEFGKLARYHNFDVITGSNKISINPKENWLKLEARIIKERNISYNKLMDHDVNHEVYEEIVSQIIIIFERFISGLSRQFIFHDFAGIGKQLTANSFFDFGLLYEDDFGKTDYRKNTTKYRETPKKVHKRTWKDEIQRKFNPEFRSKKILKSEHQANWPFYADEVIIECRSKHWCIVTIDGYDYALNGSAKGRYKIEFPTEAGMAILGKGLSDFIKMAKEL